jgi:hypothetical protein
MHKFQLGQTVEYRSRNAPPGACVVTAKLPERMAHESELSAIADEDSAPAGKAKR